MVAVIIVIWNGIQDTLECLRSLEKDKYQNKIIIIVDNGSDDGSVESIRAEGFLVQIFSTGINLGFTGGNNVGLAEARKANANYAFLLNNDTTLEPEALSTLVAAAEEHPQSGILSPVIHYYDRPDEIWFSGGLLSLVKGEALHDSTKQPHRNDNPFETSWVSGCAMLVRIKVFDEIGGFDDRFHLTWEDVDWCIRMRAANWKIKVVPGARILHKGGRSGSRLINIKSYYAVRNSLLLVKKHAGMLYFIAVWYVVGRFLRLAIRSKNPDRNETLATIVAGFLDHLRGRYGPRIITVPRKLRATSDVRKARCSKA